MVLTIPVSALHAFHDPSNHSLKNAKTIHKELSGARNRQKPLGSFFAAIAWLRIEEKSLN
jgi:hypothetical protein